MSSADVIVPSTIKPKRGLASFKTMFSSKRQSIAQIPGSDESSSPSPTSARPSLESTIDCPTAGVETSSQKFAGSVPSLFGSNQKRAMEKAVEKEKKEQAKQAIQLSTIDEKGAFIPPTPLEKGYKDNFRDNDEDYFQTIISTPPERVRTFLSTESTISPGMFSSPSSKIKRYSLPSSFMTTSQQQQQPISSEFMSVDLTTPDLGSSPPPQVPPKDKHYTAYQAQQQQPKKRNNTVHIAYLTGTEDLSEALSESISSLMPSVPSSPSHEVPDLMDDDDSEISSSTNPSPRHSTASLQDDHSYDRSPVKTKVEGMNDLILGGPLPLSS
ncbi:hypothetical protein BX616_005262 [Lobosporangium transversale]|uniref:Uncharacterized protein n=1 Tax=Lobosporangium transversale TaxID=64571 RepID=A0A1Y2GXR3_9FUNG|nr:hypothetical protein BCR41DRAFT_348019 [Lobosporangium transversale]KAF9897624.1 hypothetical protein BX616_005262 [Lobosporangium transversale]ORZ26263.1 hypothetical protein BCR41DRAFT_348019 [Lobosporangium transversale]|eukprot:XP_021884028.1 hypothetical protein BCR41DRAFT_348019 [Lobosporangium transversale]